MKTSELWDELKPFALRDIGDVLSARKQIASSEDRTNILLYSASTDKVRSYTADEDGLRGAVGAAEDNDIVVIPPVTIALTQTLTAAKKIAIVGVLSDARVTSYAHKTRIANAADTGARLVYLSGGVSLYNLDVSYTANTSTSRAAITAAGSQNALYNCRISCKNTGGDANGIDVHYTIFVDNCIIYANSTSGYGHGMVGASPGTNVYTRDSEYYGYGGGGGTGIEIQDGVIYNCNVTGTTTGLNVGFVGGG